jgi:trehalose 6-phosphate phosphatase
MTLAEALEAAAGSPVLLVASDYDGTLAPIVADPDLAYPDERALAALVALAELPHTDAAILSGRDAAVLLRLTHNPAGIELIGSHGAERAGLVPDVEAKAIEDLTLALARLESLVAEFPGARLEQKPAGVAFHYRNVEPELRPSAEAAARRVGGDYATLSILPGKQVVELTGSRVDKGDALRALREQSDAGVVVFIGDDVTDEHAFTVLGPGDLGIKVGEGETVARFRLKDQSGVAGVLESLLAHRRCSRVIA